MRTRKKHKGQQASQSQDFPTLFLRIEHEEEETVRVTESRYALSATGKDKEEALGAFWQAIAEKYTELESEVGLGMTAAYAEKIVYLQSILAQEDALKRKEVKESVEV